MTFEYTLSNCKVKIQDSKSKIKIQHVLILFLIQNFLTLHSGRNCEKAGQN